MAESSEPPKEFLSTKPEAMAESSEPPKESISTEPAMAESSEPPKESVSTELTLAGPSSQPSPSTELTLSLPGTSSEPPKDQNPGNFSFCFKIRPATARILKTAMEALSDEEYNERSMGKIQARRIALSITTISRRTRVIGYLYLKAKGLIDYKYYRLFNDKEISLKKIDETIGIMMSRSSADDHETIGIHHVQGSNELCFTLGSLPTTKFPVDLTEIGDNNAHYPSVKYACVVMIRRNLMKQILQYLDTCDVKIVSFYITQRMVYITVGKKYCCKCNYEKNRSTRGMKPGQMHCASFEWLHSESLKKALPLATEVQFSLIKNPSRSVHFLINLEKLGNLVYHAASVVELNLEQQKQVRIQDALSHLTPIHEVKILE